MIGSVKKMVLAYRRKRRHKLALKRRRRRQRDMEARAALLVEYGKPPAWHEYASSLLAS